MLMEESLQGFAHVKNAIKPIFPTEERQVSSALENAFAVLNQGSGVALMDRIALEKYHASVMATYKMFQDGIIDEKDFAKAEKYLAKKYGISKGNLYRLNNLICTPERVINIGEEKEDICYANKENKST